MNHEERLQQVYEELGGADAARASLLELAGEEADQEARVGICRVYAEALGRIGDSLWIGGAIFGPDRVEGRSPFGFGDDDVVGLATVCQIGGELARGAVALFEAGNLYAAAALVRQLLEVGYLASAFAAGDGLAAEWMRADREERRRFWSPARLRRRSNGRHLSADYWDHCDRGGHPTAGAPSLLPDTTTRRMHFSGPTSPVISTPSGRASRPRPRRGPTPSPTTSRHGSPRLPRLRRPGSNRTG
jgi:hypothetical protein